MFPPAGGAPVHLHQQPQLAEFAVPRSQRSSARAPARALRCDDQQTRSAAPAWCARSENAAAAPPLRALHVRATTTALLNSIGSRVPPDAARVPPPIPLELIQRPPLPPGGAALPPRNPVAAAR